MRKKLEWKHIFDLMSYHPIVAYILYRELLKLFYRLFTDRYISGGSKSIGSFGQPTGRVSSFKFQISRKMDENCGVECAFYRKILILTVIF